MLASASAMQLVRVAKLCEKHCLRQLSPKNCVRAWLLADRYNFGELKKKAFNVVLDSFPMIVDCVEILQLEKGSLQQVLADDHLSVACEEDVFQALVRWVQFDEDNRKTHFAQLVRSVVRVKETKMEVNTKCGML